MDDLISRDDVYNVLKKMNIREMPIYVFDKLWNEIRDLPSIEYEERTAKVEMFLCGNCHESNIFDVVTRQHYKYCPSCGARLEW